jgi:uncharacterized membrane protein
MVFMAHALGGARFRNRKFLRMLGGFLALVSAVTFAYANASMRRGVLTGTVLQAVATSMPIGLIVLLPILLLTGGFQILAGFSGRSWALLLVAGVIHFAWGRYCNYRATKAIGANLVAPIQQYSLIITLVLAVLWLGEPLTLLRIIGIALVIVGPGFTLTPEKPAASEVPPETPSDTTFVPQYAEGYTYALLSSIGFGLSPILFNMAFGKGGLAVGVAGGFVAYLSATATVALTLLLPGKWTEMRQIDRESGWWFFASGVTVCVSQVTRIMAFAVAPVSVVSPIARLSLVFRIYVSRWLNPKHEVFGPGVIWGTVISLVGAVALSVSVDDVAHALPLPAWLAAALAWHWP